MSVVVDGARCAASGMCAQIAPRVFSLDHEGPTAHVITEALQDEDEIRLAQEAERACPTLAITVSRSAETS